MKPTISVVVPVYNAEKTLKKSLTSVLKQRFQNFELILVDDGSTDKSLEICNAFAEKDERIHVIHQANKGSFLARKTGVSHAQGRYVTFLDADDYLPERSLQEMFFQTDGCDSVIVVGDYKQFTGHIRINSWQAPCFQANNPFSIKRDIFIKEYYVSWFGYTKMPVCVWAKLYPLQFCQDFFNTSAGDIVDFWGEDLFITMHLLPIAERVAVTPETVYLYRRGGGTSTYKETMLSDYLSLYCYKLNYAKNYEIPYDIQYLCDVEICNVIMSYLEMQKELAGFSNEQLTKSIISILGDSTVKSVLDNAQLKGEDSQNVQLLIKRNVTAIIDYINRKKSIKERVRKRIRRFL